MGAEVHDQGEADTAGVPDLRGGDGPDQRRAVSVVWVCSQRPDCRGRRNARNYQNAAQPAAQSKPARPRQAASIWPSSPGPSASPSSPGRKAHRARPDLTRLPPRPRPPGPPPRMCPRTRQSCHSRHPSKSDAQGTPRYGEDRPESHESVSARSEATASQGRLLVAFRSPRQMRSSRVFSSYSKPNPAPKGSKEGRTLPAATVPESPHGCSCLSRRSQARVGTGGSSAVPGNESVFIPSPAAGTSAPAPACWTPSANAPAPSRTRCGNPR